MAVIVLRLNINKEVSKLSNCRAVIKIQFEIEAVMKNIIQKNFWTNTAEPVAVYPWLAQNESCEVCIVGGGITGSLCAMYLSKAGINTVLVTSAGIGYGASGAICGASEIRPFGGINALSSKIGIQRAVNYCKRCQAAIKEFEELTAAFKDDCGFYRTDSFIFTDDFEESAALNKEYLNFLHNGFDVEMIEDDEAGEMFSFAVEKGYLFKNGGMAADPYRICQNAIAMAVDAGAGVYEYTEVTTITPQKNSIELTTSVGKSIRAKNVIFAIGEDNKEFLKDEAERCAGFQAVSDTVHEMPGWYNKCVITSFGGRESTAYVTPDNKAVMYGMETSLNPFHAISEVNAVNSVFVRRCEVLGERMKSMFPAIEGLDTEHYYAANTLIGENSLPYIKEKRGYPGCYFAACGGKNSIIHSQLAAQTMCKNLKKNDSSGL